MALHGSVVELQVGGADHGTGTTGLINGTKAMQLEIAETSVRAVHKFPKQASQEVNREIRGISTPAVSSGSASSA